MAAPVRGKPLTAAHKRLMNKPVTWKNWSEMKASGLTLKRWCWVNRVLMGVLINSMIKNYPEVWEAEKDKVGEYFHYPCKFCQLPFYANTKKSQYCSEHCSQQSHPSRISKRAWKGSEVPSGDGTQDPKR